MFDQSCADLRAAAKQQREDTFRQSAFANAFLNGTPDQFAGAWMGRMRLDDYGISSSQSRSRVSAGDGKRQGKIAGAKYHNRAQGPKHGPDVRFRGRLAVRIGGVDSRIDPRSLFRHLRKQPKLANRAGCLSLQAGGSQSSLQSSTFDDVSCDRLYFCCDGPQQRTALASGNTAVRVKGFRR